MHLYRYIFKIILNFYFAVVGEEILSVSLLNAAYLRFSSWCDSTSLPYAFGVFILTVTQKGYEDALKLNKKWT